MTEQPNLLFVCGRNKRRSRTAEYIFKNDQRFKVRSVGLSPRSERQIKDRDVEWADLVLVMSDEQSDRIAKDFRHLELPGVEILYIEDEYEYLDPELIEMLTDQINTILQTQYGL